MDRRKLELLMMNMYPPVPETAADFFGRIEEETGTVVIWPSRLKIGAKSKKGALGCSFVGFGLLAFLSMPFVQGDPSSQSRFGKAGTKGNSPN